MLEARPLLRCDAGHLEAVEVGQDVTPALRRRCAEAVPHAAARALRTDRCRACDTPLSMPVRRTSRVVTVDRLADLPPLTLRFDLPMTRCPGCGLDQLPSRSQDDFAATVTGLGAALTRP